MHPSTKQSCPHLSPSSGGQIALLDLMSKELSRLSWWLGWLPFLLVIVYLELRWQASSMYWVPAAHGAGTWHTLPIILRAPLYGRFYFPHFTGKEIEAVRGKFEHHAARLQNLCSFPTIQWGLVFDTHAYSPSTQWWAGETLLFYF